MPTVNATSSPVSWRARLAVARRRVHERLVDDVAGRRAGDAATQRCETYFQARLRRSSRRSRTARRRCSRRRAGRSATAGGNSTRLCARNVQTRLNGGASAIPFAKRSRCGVVPVGRPRDAGLLRRRRRGLLRRHELDRRRALDVARLLLARAGSRRRRRRRRSEHEHARPRSAARFTAPPPRRGASSRAGAGARPRRRPARTHRAGSSSTTRPLRASTPRIRCANEPA